jgi:hypothetical protein
LKRKTNKSFFSCDGILYQVTLDPEYGIRKTPGLAWGWLTRGSNPFKGDY